MQEYDKKIFIRIMNSISLLCNIGTLILMNGIVLLAKYIEEFSEIAENFENGKISILQQSIILGICIVFSIINLILSKNVQKNESKISLLMAISMMMGSIYNIIAGFVCTIIFYKKKKRRKKY